MFKTLTISQLFVFTVYSANLQTSPYWSSITTDDGLTNLLKNENKNSVLFYHASNRKCAACDTQAKNLTDLAKVWQDAIKFIQIDCAKFRNSKLKDCNMQNDSNLPIVLFNSFNGETVKESAGKYSGPGDVNSLKEFIFSNTKPFQRNLESNEDFTEMLKDDAILSKSIVFQEDTDKIPVEIKALSSEFYGRIEFAKTSKSSNLINKYKIKTFPSILYISKKTPGGQYAEPYIYKGRWDYKQIRLVATRYQNTTTNFVNKKVIDAEQQTKQEAQNKVNEENKKKAEALAEQEARKEQEEQKKNDRLLGYNFLNAQNLDTFFEDTKEELLLVHCYNSKEMKHYEIDIINRKLKGLVRIVDFDVSEETNKDIHLSEFKGHATPFIAMYPRGARSFRSKAVKMYGKEETLGEFAKFISGNIPDGTKPLDLESMKTFTTKAVNSFKASVVLFHNAKETLLSYKGVARLANYTEYFDFGSFPNPPMEIMKQMQIKRLPSVALVFGNFDKANPIQITQENIRAGFYSGSILFGELTKYFDGFIDQVVKGNPTPSTEDAQRQNPNQGNPKQSTANNQQVNISKVPLNYKFSECSSHRLCLYAAIDTDLPDFNDKLNVMRKLGDFYKNSNMNFMYIDGICNDDIMEKLKIEISNVPTMFAIDPKDNRYYLMTGAFNYDSIQRFVNGTLTKRGIHYEVPSGLQVPLRNCRSYKAGKQGNSQENIQSANQQGRGGAPFDADAVLNDPRQFEMIKQQVRKQIEQSGGMFDEYLKDDAKLDEFVRMQINMQKNINSGNTGEYNRMESQKEL